MTDPAGLVPLDMRNRTIFRATRGSFAFHAPEGAENSSTPKRRRLSRLLAWSGCGGLGGRLAGARRRIAVLEDSSLIARKLAPCRRALVAAPDYLTRHGEPRVPDDLAAHRCLNYGHTTTLQRWRLTHGGETLSVPITSCLCSNNGDVLRVAAIAGRGIAELPTFIVGPDIKAGRLRVVLPDYPPTELGIYALYAANRYLAAKTRVLIDFLVARFGDNPEWDRYAERGPA